MGSITTPLNQLAILKQIKEDSQKLGQKQVSQKFMKFEDPRPYTTVIGFAMDSAGRFPIFFRSNNVRSAKNAWSMPSGCHEVGLTCDQQFAVELEEELGLEVSHGCYKIGFYEAIIYGTHEPNWHWTLLMLARRVKTLDTLQNREPDKHSDIKLITVDELYSKYINENWTMGLKEALLEYRSKIESVVRPE